MAKKKYCPLDRVPEEVNVPEKGMNRVARNLWVGKKGWMVQYYTQGEMHEDWYGTRGGVLEAYPQFRK